MQTYNFWQHKYIFKLTNILDVVSESEGDGEDEEDNYEQESCNDNNRVSSKNAILSDNIAINGTEPDRDYSEEQISIGNFDYYKKFFPELSLSQVIACMLTYVDSNKPGKIVYTRLSVS